MVALEQTKNGCESDQVLKARTAANSSQLPPAGPKGGVGKPGGFNNTKSWTGRGGLLFYSGGLTTDLLENA